ncbi:hypothetical protein B0H19DRAFT_1072370 [Mycena capillaripes]|nr:hypothetical protein B0H19DRAFT_1072370 [Mycena capillaripes]
MFSCRNTSCSFVLNHLYNGPDDSRPPPGPANLFSPGVPLEESPSSLSSLSASQSPGNTPYFPETDDYASATHLYNVLIPGDEGYVFPDPNAGSISAPAIATLDDTPETDVVVETDFDFEDLDQPGYDDDYDDDHDELECFDDDEQVGGGYSLRTNITPSTCVDPVGHSIQRRRRITQTEANKAQNADANADAPVPVPAPRRPLKKAPLTPPLQLPPQHAPPPQRAPPPPQHAPQRAPPQQEEEQQRAPQRPPPQQQCAPQQQQPQLQRTQQQPFAAAPSVSGRQARSETPAPRRATPQAPTSFPAPAPPACASSLQAPATRRGTPAGFRPIPPQDFTGTYAEFIAQGDFKPADLPPPPRGWAETRRRPSPPPPPATAERRPSPLPPPAMAVERRSPLPPMPPAANLQKQETKQETKQEEDGGVDVGHTDGGADEEGGDGGDGGGNGGAGRDNTSRKGGRPTLEQTQEMAATLEDIQERIRDASHITGFSYGAILKWIYQQEVTALRPGDTVWNKYERFANYNNTNRWRERRRIDPDCPLAEHIPPLSPSDLTRAYEAFLTSLGGEEEAEKVLDLFFQAAGLSDDTYQARRRRFNSCTKTMQKQVNRLRGDDFFAVLVVVGAHTNEDEKLGKVVTAVPELAEGLFHALGTTEDEVLGFQKTIAASIIMEEQAKLRREDKAISSNAAPSAPAPASAAPAACSSTVATSAAAATSGTAAEAAAAVLPTNLPMLQRDAPTKNTVYEGEIRDDTKDLQDLRAVMARASMEDLGMEVFKLNNNGFTWTVLLPCLYRSGIRIWNYPDNVRLPSEGSKAKGSGTLNRVERRWIRFSLAARSTPGQGLRFERVAYTDTHRLIGDFVALSHDYTLPSPPGGPDSDAVAAFWSSSTAPVHCGAADNTTWAATYDINDPVSLARPETKDEVKAGKQRVESPSPTARRNGSTSQKRKAVELPQEEATPPKKSRPMQDPQVGGGGSAPRRVLAEPVRGKPRMRNDPRTPPRVNGPQPHVRFGDAKPLSDDDDEPLDKLVAPLKAAVSHKPLYDSDSEPAATRPPPRPRPKAGYKRAVPEKSDEEEGYGNRDSGSDDEAAAKKPPARLTRASSRARTAAHPKPAPAKAAPRKVFDGVEIASPPKKSRTDAPAPTAGPSRRPLASAGSSSQRGPPARVAAPAPAAPAQFPAAFPAAFNPAAFNPASLTPEQLAQIQMAMFAALFGGGGAPPPGA